MTTTTPPTAAIPNFTNAPAVALNQADGNYYFTPQMFGILSQLFIYLQQNFSQEGLKPASQPTATISSLNSAQSTSAILYDSTANEFKGCVNGTFMTFTLT